MKIINAHPGMSEPMTEDETKNFLTNIDNKLLIRVGLIDEKGETKVTPLSYYLITLIMPMIKCSLLYVRPPRKLKIKQVTEQNGFDVYNEEERGDFTFIEAREL